MPSGAGLSFFSPSTALVTMPFFGPSLAGRSNSTTGTLTLTRCAAICAPMTPAPRTATLRTLNRFIAAPGGNSFDAAPGLGAAQQREADEATHLELRSVVDRRQLDLVDLAVVRVEDVATAEDTLVATRLDVADDGHAEDRLVLALVAAILADGIGRGRRIEELLDLAAEDAVGLDDANQRLLLLGVVVDGL